MLYLRKEVYLKFIYSKNIKNTKFCPRYVVPVKSEMEISQNFVAFSEYMNFKQTFFRKWSMQIFWAYLLGFLFIYENIDLLVSLRILHDLMKWHLKVS